MVDAVSQYGPKTLSGTAAAVSAVRVQLRSQLDKVLGRFPLLATFIEWLSLARKPVPVQLALSILLTAAMTNSNSCCQARRYPSCRYCRWLS